MVLKQLKEVISKDGGVRCRRKVSGFRFLGGAVTTKNYMDVEDRGQKLGTRHQARQDDAKIDGNYKSQNPNNKQITMTEIQNPKPSHDLMKREFQICLGH